ncbi:hypothetical protein Hanom_Chr02g00134201 [Helianthus anomalus]
MIKLRRYESLVKPAKSLLSPFVVFKNLKRGKNKIANDEDNLIKTIEDWAPTSGIRDLTFTAGRSFGPDFWAALLGTDRTGWLSDDMHCQTLDQTFKGYFTGAVEPFPLIFSVDEVLMGMQQSEKGRTEVVCLINFVFDHWLRMHGYFNEKPLPLTFSFQIIYANDVPQKSGPLGDCGVWVCIFLDRLINKKTTK